MRHLFTTLYLTSLFFVIPQVANAKNQSDMRHCQDKQHKLVALCRELPKSWVLKFEHEPVFDSDILTIQAGIEHPQTVVLVHGLSQEGFRSWLPVIPQLAHHYHVLTLDLPGFGYSDSPVGKYSPSNYAKLLSWIIKRYSHGSVIVIGHSMGGAIALRFASKYPELLRKLILIDAAGILQRSAYVKQPAGLPMTIAAAPDFLKKTTAEINDWHNNVIEYALGLPDITQSFSSNQTVWGAIMYGHPNLNAAMALTEEDFSNAIYTLSTPTQILWGENDHIAPLRTGQMLARRLAMAQLHIMPGYGHTPMENPDNLATFLTTLNAALDSPPEPESHTGQTNDIGPDLHCNNKIDQTYSGNYREIRIDGCTAVKLQNISAQRVIIRDSIVEMTDVQISTDKLALDIKNSDIVATAGEINGDMDILADNSHIDMAGFKLQATKHAIEAKGSSRLIGSANKISSPDYNGYWQGNIEIRNAILIP